MYLIKHLCHRTDISMSHHGFTIDLSLEFKERVAKSGLNQEKVDYLLLHEGRIWLDCAGFGETWDPDNCGFEKDENLKPGPRARPLHRPGEDLRVTWGEWGPEHISVPGNACGLDIERSSFGCLFEEGISLLPHNVDSLVQKYLLLITFTSLAELVYLFSRDV